MPSSDYAVVPSTGKLKLKGGLAPVGDSKVKKKKKQKSTSSGVDSSRPDTKTSETPQDLEANVTKQGDLSKLLAEEDKELLAGEEEDREAWRDRGKTEAEKRWEDQRRRRLDDRLKREGIKSHKERVEELNRYLSGLSEHHDMPRIGPG